MSTLRRSVLCCLCGLLCCMFAATLSAQSSKAQEARCFNIHVRLDGQLLEGPQVITLKTNQHEEKVSRQDGCFNVSPALLQGKAIDVLFSVPGNKIYLSGIAKGFFAGPWDIDLADKSFGREVVLPKSARIREACAVVFRVGEPERKLLQTPCRTIVADKKRCHE